MNYADLTPKPLLTLN